MGRKNGWFCFTNKLLSGSDDDDDAGKKERKWKWVPARVKGGRHGESKHPSPRAEEFVAAIVNQNQNLRIKTRLKRDPETQIRQAAAAAAIAIQTCFRGYLARKALRALKGIVRLQAIIRGRAVRRQAINTLRCLQSIVNIQSQLRQSRFDAAAQPTEPSPQYNKLQLFVHKLDSNCQRRWDGSLLSKQDSDVSAFSKKEAMMRRERIKEYCSIHRRSDESERNIAKGRWRYWLDQWVDTQLSKSREVEDLDSIFRSKERQTKVKRNPNEDMESPRSFRRRKGQHRKQYSMGDESSLSGSPVVPAYMAATESAKAKGRSGGSPKQRQRSYDGWHSNSPSSPCIFGKRRANQSQDGDGKASTEISQQLHCHGASQIGQDAQGKKPTLAQDGYRGSTEPGSWLL